MDKAKPFLKAAALASSALLVGVFIGYRAGLIQLSQTPEPNPASQSATSSPTPTPPTSEPEPVFMSGTKSGNVSGLTIGLKPAEQLPDLPLPEPTTPTFMGGPKFNTTFVPADLPQHKPVLTGTKLDSIMSGTTTNPPPVAPLFPPTNPTPPKPGE